MFDFSALPVRRVNSTEFHPHVYCTTYCCVLQNSVCFVLYHAIRFTLPLNMYYHWFTAIHCRSRHLIFLSTLALLLGYLNTTTTLSASLYSRFLLFLLLHYLSLYKLLGTRNSSVTLKFFPVLYDTE